MNLDKIFYEINIWSKLEFIQLKSKIQNLLINNSHHITFKININTPLSITSITDAISIIAPKCTIIIDFKYNEVKLNNSVYLFNQIECDNFIIERGKITSIITTPYKHDFIFINNIKITGKIMFYDSYFNATNYGNGGAFGNFDSYANFKIVNQTNSDIIFEKCYFYCYVTGWGSVYASSKMEFLNGLQYTLKNCIFYLDNAIHDNLRGDVSDITLLGTCLNTKSSCYIYVQKNHPKPGLALTLNMGPVPKENTSIYKDESWNDSLLFNVDIITGALISLKYDVKLRPPHIITYFFDVYDEVIDIFCFFKDMSFNEFKKVSHAQNILIMIAKMDCKNIYHVEDFNIKMNNNSILFSDKNQLNHIILKE